MKARHSRAKIWLKPNVECCAYPAMVLYVHIVLAFFLSIFASHSSCFGLSTTRYFFIPAASGTCARFCVSKPSPVHRSTCRVACSARDLGAGCESLTLTLQHAVDVQIFECAPEFLRLVYLRDWEIVSLEFSTGWKTMADFGMTECRNQARSSVLIGHKSDSVKGLHI